MSRAADVVVPVYRDVELTRACVESVLACSGDALRSLVLVYDRGPEPAMLPLLCELRAAHPRIRLLENEQNLGFVASCNRGLALRQGHAVLLNNDTRVTPGWLDELLAVLEEDPRIGAVVPLSNNAAGCSVPAWGEATPVEQLEGRPLGLSELPRWTELPTAVGFCLLLRHEALNLAGGLDPAFGRGYHEENDWCQRAQALGFRVVRANRALVYHLGQVSFGEARSALDLHNGRRLVARYPHYLEQNARFDAGPQSHLAATGAVAALGRLRVCLDARRAPATGDAAPLAAQLARSLAVLPKLELSVRVDPELAPLFAGCGAKVLLGDEPGPVPHLLHCPVPVADEDHARALLELPAHLVLTWWEPLAMHSAGALGSWAQTERFRALQWALAHAAQGLVTFSEAAARELRATFDLQQAHVAAAPVAFDPGQALPAEAADRSLRRLGLTGDYVLALLEHGPADNLGFLLDAWSILRARLVDRCPTLVLAGIVSHPVDAERASQLGALQLGPLEPQDRLSALAGANALALPSSQVPTALPLMQAAAFGVPAVALGLPSTVELLGDGAALVPDYSFEGFASALLRLLEDPAARAEQIARGRDRVAQLSWQRTAEATLRAYLDVASRPRPESLRARDALEVLFRLGP